MALIEIRGLYKSYGRAEILKEIDLKADRGEILAIIGPTGAGKTTLLRMIDLIDVPTKGQIFFEGQEVSSLPERQKLAVRRRIAMVFQKPVMFNSSVYDNVAYGLRIRGRGRDREAVQKALELVGLSGYEGRDATTLSGGEMQRIALARAMVIEPEVLLLDEPTANLDPGTASSIDDLIRKLARDKGTAVIISTHNMRQCRRLADRVAVMRVGRITKVSRPEEIFAGHAALGAAEDIRSDESPEPDLT
ncbi:MAG TPA: phosphate ABC transporter ATP-binding protein [Methanotrichaceae archaeon]|nr:phosphate ABC transporter ATP-binding protein [Methanotrichaceae archaeon]